MLTRDDTRPRILMWIPLPPPYAGPEVASASLADAIRAHLPDLRIENASLRASNMSKGRLDLSGIVAFARAYLRFLGAARNSDVIYLIAAANTVGCLRDAVLIGTSRALGKRVVLHLRGGRYGEYYSAGNWAMRSVLRFAWGSASRAIVQTPRLRHALDEAAPRVDVATIPNGLDAAAFGAKKSYGTAAPRILFVGHLLYSKGFYDLMHAFRALRRQFPAAELVCAGELPRPERHFADFLPVEKQQEYIRRRFEMCEEIRAFASSGDGVRYCGVVDGATKADLFANADVFVLPSYSEGFSLAILEAMFHGLPVVTTSAGGSPDVVVHERNGLVIEPGDTASLAEALGRLLANESMRRDMGERNAREARERYDIAIVARDLARILREPDTRDRDVQGRS